MALYAKSAPEWTLLSDHLKYVSLAAQKFAQHLNVDLDWAKNGAILHDIGKAHPIFQKRLTNGRRASDEIFRHEIASLFFLSAFPEKQWGVLIEMVVGHHKSVKNDVGNAGLLDMEELCDYEDFHLGNWVEWSEAAWTILKELGVPYRKISVEEAKQNLLYSIEYCNAKVKERGFSEWKGLLMGADHFASALNGNTESNLSRLFKKPDLTFYNRTHPLYPLSLVNSESEFRHTIVVASTGAGKTDFLFRRCKGRVFYTLPFQASINAMFKRVEKDLEAKNPNLDIRVLHSTSKLDGGKEETVLQPLVGSSVKILTPYQLAALAFGMKGYESLILDLRGCDVVLDEVHTYTGISQAIVLKLVEVLKHIGCRIHIGTATMPSLLYKKIKEILGNDVLEVKLNTDELDKFDRHIVYKRESFEATKTVISEAVEKQQKVLIVVNKVKTAQEIYKYVVENYSEIPHMLLHSRFKRGDRNSKESELIGLDKQDSPLYVFNTSEKACIVVSTQIVEVSLDISFDIMITECAPLDALIQRFGRVNRKRSSENIGLLKPVYVIAPPETDKDAKPYELEILKSSFDILEDGEALHERDLQQKIDDVFTSVDFLNIEQHSIFKAGKGMCIDYLTHNDKAVLFDLLEIDSVSCITESDEYDYENGNYESRLLLEIPTYYYAVAKMRQSKKGNCPFIIPDAAYSEEYGLFTEKIN